MNKTPIEWCDMTWNPVSGCWHPCRNTYCYNTTKHKSYLNRFGARYLDNGVFIREKNWKSREKRGNYVAEEGEVYPYGYAPTFYPHRLAEVPIKGSLKIFVVDVGDLFGNWVPIDWIQKVLDVAAQRPNHTFMFLTKNPQRYSQFSFTSNCWLGATVESDYDIRQADALRTVPCAVRYLSIEPLHGPIAFDLQGSQWVIIGAETGAHPSPPNPLWVTGVVTAARHHAIPIFMKSNLAPYWSGPLAREYP